MISNYHSILQPYKEITGIILAGGKSLRYGSNKALEKIEGIPLIERVIHTMKGVFQTLILITNSPKEYAYLQLPMHRDIITGLGPLGGIYTGLETISNEAGFFVACDMPFLNIDLIRHMVEMRDHFDAVVPKIDWKFEALHALYSKRCLPFVRELIDAGGYQVINFFHRIRVRYLEEEEIRVLDPHMKSFININKPEEMAQAMNLNNINT